MKPKWLSTSDLAWLLEEYVPVTPGLIRDLCEEGTIPREIAKRIPGRKQGHWRIAVKGLPALLKDVYELSAKEIGEVESRLVRVRTRA